MNLKIDPNAIYLFKDDQFNIFSIEGDKVLRVDGAIAEYLNSLNFDGVLNLEQTKKEFLESYSEYKKSDVSDVFDDLFESLVTNSLAIVL